MKSHRWLAALLMLLVAPRAFSDEPIECRVKARFSSEGSIGQAVIEAIRQTKTRLTLALYGFDSTDLEDELLKLVKKNVVVRLKVDANRSAGKKITQLFDQLRAGGVQLRTVAPNGRNHNKFAVIDGTRVMTGSYNWTLKSEGNWENLLILDCPELAKKYEGEWEKIR
jgi:phosphatidylserine/phosphatidylglycerophosphate/cardiolipin synthase-like enzyme